MIDFSQFDKNIIPFVLSYEGGYVNNPKDRGGETYRGIARKFNPTWIGWPAVDKFPGKKTNTIIPALETSVKQFYWDKYFKAYNLHLLNDVNVARAIFDFVVNSGMGNASPVITAAVNKAFGKSFKSVNNIQTLVAFNTLDSTKLQKAIADGRDAYIKRIVEKNPSQAVFLTGWKNRLDKVRSFIEIPGTESIDLMSAKTQMPLIIGVVVIIAIAIWYNKKKAPKYA